MREKIIGKYEIVDIRKPNQRYGILTDNPLEAIWEANKCPEFRIINNICGEKEFYKKNGKYRVRRS